jgi:hypothetical protein
MKTLCYGGLVFGNVGKPIYYNIVSIYIYIYKKREREILATQAAVKACRFPSIHRATSATIWSQNTWQLDINEVWINLCRQNTHKTQNETWELYRERERDGIK